MWLALASTFICVLEIAEPISETETLCAHCGDQCDEELIVHEDNSFCCHGCKTVYSLLVDNDLDQYYKLEQKPGVRIDADVEAHAFEYLDDPEIRRELVKFDNGQITRLDLHLPQIHCSSCIWLLENISKLHPGVKSASVNFPKRTAHIMFQNELISLSELVRLLASIGYQPDFSKPSKDRRKGNKKLLYKIGIAGFCFGNIMLLAFPEYLGIDSSFQQFKEFFGYLSLLLSIPVFFYAGFEYIISAYKSVRRWSVNMDLPIALGMITLMARSSYEILAGVGAGYLDSLAGFVFFLLVGRWFQKRTYEGFSFDRDYHSYFPLGVRKMKEGKVVTIKLGDIQQGDQLEIRNNELIPSDAILLQGDARIDYSFVTGESDPVKVREGETVYAGGKQVGGKILVTVLNEVDSSYLTQLWNTEAFRKEKKPSLGQLTNQMGKYFTIGVIVITVIAGFGWWLTDPQNVWNIVSSILIVACPCALALSVPFTFGNVTRVLGEKGMYLKNTDVVERMSKTTDVIFDKTGTLTVSTGKKITIDGNLDDRNMHMVACLAGSSTHPLSQAIARRYNTNGFEATNVEEIPGAGLMGIVDDVEVKIGSASFVKSGAGDKANNASEVWVSINGTVKGRLLIQQRERVGIRGVLSALGKRFGIHLISGDKRKELSNWQAQIPAEQILFECTPQSKMEYVSALQREGKSVLMVGDGLNDAGALQQSNVGIAVSDQAHQFSPACDAILDAKQMEKLPAFLRLASQSINVVKASFAISLLYNAVGLYFAISGQLSPVVAAILMPLSSISVVLFATVTTRVLAGRTKD